MLLRNISQYSIILPILSGLIVYRKAGFPYRLFLFMLIYGFLTDVMVTLHLISIPARFFIFNIYSLIETAVILLFVANLKITEVLRKLCYMLLIALLITWIVTHYSIFRDSQLKFSATYESLYTLTISLVSGYALLKIGEINENLPGAPSFWFLIAIFLNCFCIFFIKNFMEAEVMRKLWYLTNIVNVINYIFISIGYFTIAKGHLNTSKTTLARS